MKEPGTLILGIISFLPNTPLHPSLIIIICEYLLKKITITDSVQGLSICAFHRMMAVKELLYVLVYISV